MRNSVKLVYTAALTTVLLFSEATVAAWGHNKAETGTSPGSTSLPPQSVKLWCEENKQQLSRVNGRQQEWHKFLGGWLQDTCNITAEDETSIYSGVNPETLE